MKSLVSAILLVIPLAVSAGVCDTAWDGDRIISSLSGRSANLRVPLKDKDQLSSEITLRQLQVFHEAKDRISRVVGIIPTFLVCGDNVPNAFAGVGPSGEVVAVSVGMLNLANGDRDMAAAVIGHEFAHHVKQHGANSQVRDNALGILGLIAGVALEYNLQKKHGVGNVGLELGQTGAVLVGRKFDRDQEREVDDLGFQYMLSAGYNPEGAVRLWERMSRLGSGGGWFYDTHPGSNERVHLLRAKIASSPQAQQIIARSRNDSVLSSNAGTVSSEQPVTFAPSYQVSDAQKAFQEGMLAYQAGKHAQAFEKFNSSAAAGYPPAQGALGFLLEKGYGTQANLTEAVSWYRKAAGQGVPGAQVSLGSLYERGVGVPQSDADAFAHYSKAAEQGHPLGVLSLASMYERGKGSPKDAGKAFELVKKVSDQGLPAGHYALSRAYAMGIGVEKNQSESASLLRKAADMGDRAAQTTLGWQYIAGSSGTPKSPEEGISWLRKAAEQNHAPALYQLGSAYEVGIGVGKDIGMAMDYYTKAANSGLKDADVALTRLKRLDVTPRSGTQLANDKSDAQVCDRFASFEDLPDRGIKKAYFGFIDVDKALPACLAALRKSPGDTRAQAQLARIYFQLGKFVEGVDLARKSMKEQRISLVVLAYAQGHGLGGYSVDLSEAAKLLRQAVDRGESEAMEDLSAAYAFGKGLPKDERQALELLQRSADSGDLNATFSLALVRNRGLLGTTKDTEEALRLMQKVADSGALPSAQFRLGMILVEREKQVTPEAQRYFTSAKEELERFSQMGSARARTLLGEMYERGIGVGKNPSKAVDLYRAAVSHGNTSAMTRLGIAYLNGVGTEKNPQQGKLWLEKAAKMGSDTATKKLAEVSGD
ncbi:MAG: sel1 repeat family protein [Accumulibacter sp.]|uniref:sel1 repeat family protein n=1 Tax=Accumulibacter sp. TaxID=2053492 RepID=UPI0033161642